MNGFALVVEGHHAVLLATDRDAVGAVEEGAGRIVEGLQPGARVDRRARRMGGAVLVDDTAVRSVHEHRLGRLGGGVDAEDKGGAGHGPNLYDT